MKIEKLSDSTLAALKPKGGDRIYDERNRSLCVRPNRRGEWVFYYRYRAHGKTKELVLGRWSKSEPRPDKCLNVEEARKEIGSLMARIDPIGEREKGKDALTLGEFITCPNPELPDKDFWFYRTGLYDHKTEKRDMEREFGRWYDKKLTEINKPLLQGWYTLNILGDEKTKKRSIERINKILNPMRVLMNMAVDKEYIARNPVGMIKRAKVNTTVIPKYATEEELLALRHALRKRDADKRAAQQSPFPPHFVDYLEPFILLLIDTGSRPIDILRLTWECIDFKSETICIKGKDKFGQGGTKNGFDITKPLSNEGLNTLKLWRERQEAEGLYSAKLPVFPSPATKDHMVKVPMLYFKFKKEAGLEQINLYSIRHAFGTQIIASGADLRLAADMMGHKNMHMINRYAHSRGLDVKKAALNRMMEFKKNAAL